jgi:hypothetical protein
MANPERYRSYYLDPVEFTNLFRNNRGNRNRRRILAGLHLIARGASRKFATAHRHDLEDAAQDSLLLAEEKIPCFDPLHPGADAWQYFTTLILRSMRRKLQIESKRRGRHIPLENVLACATL